MTPFCVASPSDFAALRNVPVMILHRSRMTTLPPVFSNLISALQTLEQVFVVTDEKQFESESSIFCLHSNPCPMSHGSKKDHSKAAFQM